MHANKLNIIGDLRVCSVISNFYEIHPTIRTTCTIGNLLNFSLALSRVRKEMTNVEQAVIISEDTVISEEILTYEDCL